MALSEKAIQAGITEEDGEFLASIFPKILMGTLFDIPLVSDKEVRHMLSLLDKLIAVDPETVPPHMQPSITRLRQRVQVH